MKSRNYLVALSKVYPFSNTKEFCGCITPSEAVELLNNGASAIGHYDDFMRKRKKLGDSSPSWFYFIPSKELLVELRAKKQINANSHYRKTL
jgi:hypothetical protein